MYVKAPAPDREPRLADMLARETSFRTFGTPAELGRLVRDDLATLLSERFVAVRPGSPDAALAFLATSEGPLNDLERARRELLRAQIASSSRRGPDGASLLLRAAQRLRPLDARSRARPISRRTWRRRPQVTSGAWRSPWPLERRRGRRQRARIGDPRTAPPVRRPAPPRATARNAGSARAGASRISDNSRRAADDAGDRDRHD